MKKSDFNLDDIQLLIGEAVFSSDEEVEAFYEYLDKQTRDKFKDFDAARRKSHELAATRYIK